MKNNPSINELLNEKLMEDALTDAINEIKNKTLTSSKNCPQCGSSQGQWRGIRQRKKSNDVHRRQCKNCSRWFQLPTT